jgi:hypothetical protein|tara:strand:+ start:2086 stop:2259 length:174 start_codon:yes stop_codon:yes gene_type:complete
MILPTSPAIITDLHLDIGILDGALLSAEVSDITQPSVAQFCYAEIFAAYWCEVKIFN